MAGGAIMGVIAAAVKAKDTWREGFPVLTEAQATGPLGEWIGLVALLALCTYVVVYSRRAKADA
jgi:NADH:ubiquinone oxidoreductase subunit 6 (subunit J)